MDLIKSKKLSSQKVFSGIRWGVAGRVVDQAIRFLVTIALVRLLAPEDFGLLAMASVIVGLGEIFQSLGTSQAIIQRKNLSGELLSSLVIFNGALGLLFTIFLVVSGPILGSLVYESPQAGAVIQVLGLLLFISSLGLVPKALVTRNVRFDRLVQIEFVAAFLQGIVAISLALKGWGVWALVTGSLLSSSVSTVLLWWISPCPLSGRFNWVEVKGIMNFSLHLSGSQLVDYILGNSDKIIIGRFLDAASLGYYAMAKSFLNPILSITGLINNVLFPTLSRVQDDDTRLQNWIFRAVGCTSLFMFPLLVGLSIVASPFVLGVLGEQWMASVPVLTIICLGFTVRWIGRMVNHIFVVKGRSDYLFWWTLATHVFTVVGCFGGLPWGIVGIAAGFTIGILPMTILKIYFSLRFIHFNFGRFLAALSPYVFSSALMAGVVLWFRVELERVQYEPLEVLIICGGVGMIVYCSTILFIRPPALVDLVGMVPPRYPKLQRWVGTALRISG